jgi:hypothetical protein
MGHSWRPDKAAQRANDAGSIGDRTPRGEFKSKLSGSEDRCDAGTTSLSRELWT